MKKYDKHMLAGYELMLKAGDEENNSHPGIKALANRMHEHWDAARTQFTEAAAAIPTANIQWATAVEMALLAENMKKRYGIPQ